jgi:hypothetical protein
MPIMLGMLLQMPLKDANNVNNSLSLGFSLPMCGGLRTVLFTGTDRFCPLLLFVRLSVSPIAVAMLSWLARFLLCPAIARLLELPSFPIVGIAFATSLPIGCLLTYVILPRECFSAVHGSAIRSL